MDSRTTCDSLCYTALAVIIQNDSRVYFQMVQDVFQILTVAFSPEVSRKCHFFEEGICSPLFASLCNTAIYRCRCRGVGSGSVLNWSNRKINNERFKLFCKNHFDKIGP